MNCKKKLLIGIATLLVIPICAREWRTPRVFQNGYPYAHYPFLRLDDKCWNLSLWGAGLYRSAGEAFLDKQTTKRESLAGIFFGKPSFTLAEAGITSNNPLTQFITLTPTFDYRERDAYFGFIYEQVFGCDCQWRWGVRANLPFRDITTTLDSCCDLGASEDVVTQLYVSQNELVCNGLDPNRESFVRDSFAIRLDFLSSLPLAVNSTDKFVRYADPDRGNRVTMGGVDVTNNLNPAPAIQVVSRPNGTKPDTPFALRNTGNPPTPPADCARTPVDMLATLPADGSGVPEEQRRIFASTANFYLPLGASTENQSKLWVVPTARQGALGNFDLDPAARTIQSRLNNIVNQLSSSVSNILTATGISFQTQRNVGIGDLDTEFYIGRNWCNYFWQAIAGLRLPTGRRINNSLKTLLVPTGNNGHLELKLGGLGGWNPNDWFALKLDSYINYAVTRKEKVAAAFTGATVKNIGPSTEADISWFYYVGDIDLTFLIPCIEPVIGVDAGYQLYIKAKDKVKFNTRTAHDFAGVERMLNDDLLEFRTDQVAHKVKGEVFYQNCDWQIFAGFQHVFAGKNAPNDSDWYLGVMIYF